VEHEWLEETCGTCVFRKNEHCFRSYPRVHLIPGQPKGTMLQAPNPNQITFQKVSTHPPVSEDNPACGEWTEVPN